MGGYTVLRLRSDAHPLCFSLLSFSMHGKLTMMQPMVENFTIV
jgi:hypothetical protein